MGLTCNLIQLTSNTILSDKGMFSDLLPLKMNLFYI